HQTPRAPAGAKITPPLTGSGGYSNDKKPSHHAGAPTPMTNGTRTDWTELVSDTTTSVTAATANANGPAQWLQPIAAIRIGNGAMIISNGASAAPDAGVAKSN